MSRACQAGPAPLRRLSLKALAHYWAVRADQERLAGRHRDAERLARKALVVAARLVPADHVLRLRLLNTLGIVGKYRGRFAAASRAYAHAVSILRACPEPDLAHLAALYHNRSGLEHARGRYARTEVLARHAMTLRARTLGATHHDVARDLAALDAILDGRGRHEQAEECHRRALAMLGHGLGSPHRDV